MENVEEREDPLEDDDEDRQGGRPPLALLTLNSTSKKLQINLKFFFSKFKNVQAFKSSKSYPNP